MIRSLFFVTGLFAFPLQAMELETKEFFVCFQKKATEVESRTVRIHQFPEKNKCAVIYSVDGQDQMVSQGRWLTFCEKKAKQVAANLQKGLWKCEQQKNKVKVFYSVSFAEKNQST